MAVWAQGGDRPFILRCRLSHAQIKKCTAYSKDFPTCLVPSLEKDTLLLILRLRESNVLFGYIHGLRAMILHTLRVEVIPKPYNS